MVLLTRSSRSDPRFAAIFEAASHIALITHGGGKEEGEAIFSGYGSGRRFYAVGEEASEAASSSSSLASVLADAVGWAEGNGGRRQRSHHAVWQRIKQKRIRTNFRNLGALWPFARWCGEGLLLP